MSARAAQKRPPALLFVLRSGAPGAGFSARDGRKPRSGRHL